MNSWENSHEITKESSALLWLFYAFKYFSARTVELSVSRFSLDFFNSIDLKLEIKRASVELL